MDKQLQQMFQENGWRYWDLREKTGPLDQTQFDPRVGKLVQELQRRLEPPYGLSCVEDYTERPRDERTLAILTIYELRGNREIDTAVISVNTEGHVSYNDFTDGKKLEAILQGLGFE